MQVKICGITNYEDAIASIEAGADALGFVFYEHSSRYISYQKVQEIISKLPPFVKNVGLFVNKTSQYINKISKEINIDLAQLHFEVDDTFCNNLDINYIKVVRVKEQNDILRYNNEYRLVDAFVESYGGEGKQINQEWFRDIDCSKMILAGGLNPQNIADLKQYNFAGFDVSSGVEISKGKKDIEKVKRFIEIAKA
jgi:phosphoribosylanthranilate isomerase